MKFRKLICACIACMALIDSASAMEFTDAEGRCVSVEAPSRVVSLYNSYGDAWVLSGGALAGSVTDPFADEGACADADIVNLGSHRYPNMELLFSLEPDFVLLSSSVSAHFDIAATLERAGIACAFFDTPDWRGYMESIRIFTRLTGCEDIYEMQKQAVEQPIGKHIAAAQAIDAHYGKTTALLLRADSAAVKAKGSENTVAGNILRDMGFVNLADGDSPLAENLSMENIIIDDPDWIFLITGGTDTRAAMTVFSALITDNPAWNTLTAVREGRFVILDRQLFHYHPNARWAEAYEHILKLIKGEYTG